MINNKLLLLGCLLACWPTDTPATGNKTLELQSKIAPTYGRFSRHVTCNACGSHCKPTKFYNEKLKRQPGIDQTLDYYEQYILEKMYALIKYATTRCRKQKFQGPI